MKKLVLFVLLALTTVAASAAPPDLPPGRWWRNPGVAQRLALEPAQQSRLDAIFADAANELIDRRADVQKLTVALRSELDQPQLNRQNLQQIAARLSAARGRLFERELMMLADFRGVLTDPQWTRLRAQADRRRAPRQKRQ